MKKTLFLLFIFIYSKTNAQTFIGKVGMATNTISSITYANADSIMSKYGYKFLDYYERKNTKIYIDSKAERFDVEETLLIYFTEKLDELQAITLNLTEGKFNESLVLMKFYKFQNEDFKFGNNNGLKWVKSDSPYRFFTDAKHKTITVFYVP